MNKTMITLGAAALFAFGSATVWLKTVWASV